MPRRSGPPQVSPAPRPLRRDAELTRKRLFEVAAAAFAAKGLAATQLTSDILGPSGVSAGSFYHQFDDKVDLLIAILEQHGASFRERLAQEGVDRAGSGFEEGVRASYRFAFRVAEEEGDLLRIQLRERDCHEPRVARYLQENEARWVEALAGIFAESGEAAWRRSLDARLGAELVLKLGLAAVRDYLALPPARRRQERERLIDGLVKFTVGGLPALNGA